MKTQKIIKEIDSLLYRKLMNQYFRMNEWNYLTTITSVKTFSVETSRLAKKKDELIIEIETHRPGILIGKAGRFMEGLVNFIKEETNENIKLHIKECTLWHNLYK